MRRTDKELSDPNGIESILREARFGRLGVIDAEGPYIVPVCFGYAPGLIYVHSAGQGRKINAIRNDNRVCFEAESGIEMVPSMAPCDWGVRYFSVIASGRARLLADRDEKRIGLDHIMAKYAPAGTHDYRDDAVDAIEIIEITIEHITGKKSGY